MIAGLQRHAGDALVIELAARLPFHRPPLHLPVRVGHHDLQQRVRIAIRELQHLAVDRRLLVFKIGRGERVMRVHAAPARQCADDQDGRRGSLHHNTLIVTRAEPEQSLKSI